MLQLQNICKKYTTGELTQTALDRVSLNLRDNEFVAVLGPSGSGKTTLLNIIGGLDQYDSGDLIINSISTKKYKSRDWDSYRNHTIGFVFQSYNLIPHQSILANVELALTISGVSRAERRKRAKKALEQVGLGDQGHKRPNQLSGGQMQRVAIARALINNPDILLADEPTGALDTETSLQVMELLKEVAKDRLVVMVTHNPELAEQYANRIVKLRDGKIIGDSNPYVLDKQELAAPTHKNMGKSSMSFLTSLALSFNNLRTKKGRTILTSFAGSIGIIGIALILSLSNGVNNYINDIQHSTMTSYPIQIDATTFNLQSMMEGSIGTVENKTPHDDGMIHSNNLALELTSSMTNSITKNNLTSFKKYLDDPKNEIHKYIGDSGIVYSYDVNFNVYAVAPTTKDGVTEIINTDGSIVSSMYDQMDMSNTAFGAFIPTTVNRNFDELLPQDKNSEKGALVGTAVTDNFEKIYGEWPKSANEVVLIADKNNEVSLSTLYEIGLLPVDEYRTIYEAINRGENPKIPDHKISYQDICRHTFYLIPACDTYVKDEQSGYFNYIGDNTSEIGRIINSGNAYELKIVGILRPKDDNAGMIVGSTIGYTQALTNEIIDRTENSAVVKAQLASPDKNVLNGLEFDASDITDEKKIEQCRMVLASLGTTQRAKIAKGILKSMNQGEQADAMDEITLSAYLDALINNPQMGDQILLSLYDEYVSPGTYDENMKAFGVVSYDAPSSISLYADTFEAKENIAKCIKEYNKTASDTDEITYTDYVGLLMSSVTTIVDVITYVLVAFVSVSLVVSSIMIGIITYISVLERTKEIGILRALGASKSNVAQVFNAETAIIGLCAGLMGIGITLLLLIPINAIIHAVAGEAANGVNAVLGVDHAIVLIVLSVALTCIGGLIPSKKAAKKDPVTALRTE